MKVFKHLLALALVAVMLLGAVGCTGGETSDDGLTEIRMWTNKSHSKKIMTELVNEWNETVGKEKGIKFVYEVREGDIGKDVDVAIAAGNAPELFETGNHVFPGNNRSMSDLLQSYQYH